MSTTVRRVASKAQTIAKARALYPDSYNRVRSVCVYAAFGVDLDHHAAVIVLTANGVKA